MQALWESSPAHMNGIRAVRPSERSCAIFSETDIVFAAAARIMTQERRRMEGFWLPCAHLPARALPRRTIATLHVQDTRN